MIIVSEDEFVWRKKFGDKLKRLIHIADIKQWQVAQEIGITEATLSRYITGQYVPNMYIGHKLAKILNCSVENLYDVEN